MRLSFIIGNLWLRFNYPDSAIYRFSAKTWDYQGRKQSRTEWRKVFPKQKERQ